MSFSSFVKIRLRTIFALLAVLAIFFSWLGAQLKWIRDRQEAWKSVSNNPNVIWVTEPTPADRFPWILRMLGEVRHEVSLSIVAATAKEQHHVAKLAYLFPEATITIAQIGDTNRASR